MQYWQRRLQRSVTDTRRLRNGRAKRSRVGISCRLFQKLCYSRPDRHSRGGDWMTRRHWTCVLVSCALLTAAPIAQNRPPRNPAGAQPQQPPKDDARTEKLKAEAVADVDSMQTFTQQMVDSIFSFGELGFQEIETNRYLIDILEKNGFSVQKG